MRKKQDCLQSTLKRNLSMPRTKSSKEDNRNPLEKLHQIESKIDRLIFFNYYDGYSSDGTIGFDIKAGPPGSSKHRNGIFQTLTKNQFRSKGKKLAKLSLVDFVRTKAVPPIELRPQLTLEDVESIREISVDSRSPSQKLSDVTDPRDLFIFKKYYEGYKTNGEEGFNLHSGPPGSVNHKRTYSTFLASMSESQFRSKGKILAALAKEFVMNNVEPTVDVPAIERDLPWGMMEEALTGGY